MKTNNAKLILKDGSVWEGRSLGAQKSASGEVVFATGMVGYPEALTDPSFHGQILVLTYPLVGNYGVPEKKYWESEKIQVSGLIVSSYIDTPSHHQSTMTLAEWFRKEGLPLLEIKDTRALTEKLRDQGVILGRIKNGPGSSGFSDPNKRNLVAEVSTKKIFYVGTGGDTIVLIDCGTKANIARRLSARGFRVAVVPWDTDVSQLRISYKAVVISNGPGDPIKVKKTIRNVEKLAKQNIPILGICLGNQILALAFGGSTYKLKFGHRSQNQPCIVKTIQGVPTSSSRVYLTTQNHGFAVGRIPKGFKEWFKNGNDGTNEGIIHKELPFMSVQFHPESSPGPLDTDWVFDFFFKKAGIAINKNHVKK